MARTSQIGKNVVLTGIPDALAFDTVRGDQRFAG
jgi:hypothetical protein